MTRQIPFALPSIDEDEIQAVTDTMRSGWLTMGKKTFEFEDAIAKYTGAKHAIAVNSCTAALHLSLLASGIGPGDEVITSSFTFAATGNTIVHCGAKPVFADIDPVTYNIDPEEVAGLVTRKTKAILPVHYAGQPCDRLAIHNVALENDLLVIEDAAHAIGASYKGIKIGGFGNPTCFSFYATKNIKTGEGGAITTNDSDFADRVRKLRLHGISKDAWNRYGGGSWRYDIELCGWKYNTTDINASMGLCQLRKLDGFNAIRKEYARMYSEGLAKVKGIVIPNTPMDDHIYHLYPLLVPAEHRDSFIVSLAAQGVSCSVHFIPLHTHPFYVNKFGKKSLPMTEHVFNKEVSLPLYPKMNEDDVRYVIKCVKDYMGSI
jgi:dTDP-4-amino-4,6-dideoxygalactose transaminase